MDLCLQGWNTKGHPCGMAFLSRGDTIRTCDLYVPNVALYQLSYTPMTLSCGGDEEVER
jgi:hypothetical protein